MEIDVNKLLEVSKELALHKHVLEMDLANAKHEASTKLAQVHTHAQAALIDLAAEVEHDAEEDLAMVKKRLEDIVKLVKGE